VLIHVAAPEDAASVVELLAAQLAEHDIDTPRAGIERAVGGMIADPRRGVILLGREGDRAVAVAFVSYTWSLEHGGQTSWLEELYVRPELRERGLGRALLAAAREHAARAGCAAMDLEVTADHARAARLYEREGWTPLARARWVKRLRVDS
jgi:GNAT superfamily N-acetyltransferase